MYMIMCTILIQMLLTLCLACRMTQQLILGQIMIKTQPKLVSLCRLRSCPPASDTRLILIPRQYEVVAHLPRIAHRSLLRHVLRLPSAGRMWTLR